MDQLNYVGLCPRCRCLLTVCHGTLKKDDIAAYVSDWIKRDFEIARLSNDEVKTIRWGHEVDCPLNRD